MNSLKRSTSAWLLLLALLAPSSPGFGQSLPAVPEESTPGRADAQVATGAIVDTTIAARETLFDALETGDFNRVDALLKRGASVDTTNAAGRTPFMVATAQGRLAMMELLHERGALVNAEDDAGRTALELAAMNGEWEALQWLLDYLDQRNLDVAPESGGEALLLAAKKGKWQLAERLVDKGASVSVQDENGKTALDFAKRDMNEKMQKVLKDL